VNAETNNIHINKITLFIYLYNQCQVVYIFLRNGI